MPIVSAMSRSRRHGPVPIAACHVRAVLNTLGASDQTVNGVEELTVFHRAVYARARFLQVCWCCRLLRSDAHVCITVVPTRVPLVTRMPADWAMLFSAGFTFRPPT